MTTRKMQKVTIFFIFFISKTSQDLPPVQTPEFDQQMVDSLSRIVGMIGKLKIAVWWSEKNELISKILENLRVPFVINAVEHPKKKGLETRTPSEVVIVLDEVDVHRILNETLWNGNTRFLIISSVFENIEKDFKRFWKYKVINVFEFFKQKDDIHIFSFNPYKKGNCFSTFPEVVDKFELNSGNFANNGNIFKDLSRIKNMEGCPINITVVDVKPNVIFHDECNCNGTTHISGIEGNVMNEVAKKLNFNATFVIALDGIGWGWINPSPHGAVGEVYTGRSDFAIGLLAPTIERYESLDVSIPYNGEECITYGVPKGARTSTPYWITILSSEFNPITWVLVLLSFISVIIFFEMVNQHLPSLWFTNKINVFLFTFSSCLGLPVKIPKYLYLRILILFWVIFSFITTVAYKASMGSKLTVPNEELDIDTFQQLLDSDLELTGYNNMLRLLQYNDRESVIQEMINRFKITTFDIDYAVDRIAAEKKIAYVRHTTTFLYYALINPKAKGHIHVIKDCIYLYHPMVVTKKHSPFSNRLNILISRMMESGITKKWRSDYIYDFESPAKPFLKLSIDHMYGVFCILCVGYALGFFVFLAEVVYDKIKKFIKSM